MKNQKTLIFKLYFVKNTLHYWAFFLPLIAFCQNTESVTEESTQTIQEIKVDVLEGLLVPNIEISYEYALSYSSGIGALTKIDLSGEDVDFTAKFVLQPYYRQYFYQKQDFGINGVFIEGCLRYAVGKAYTYDDSEFPYPIEPNEVHWHSAGIGFSLGKKWINQNGFLFEALIGGGRYLAATDGPEGFFNGGLVVGYRF